jgi:hypothetical protein
MYRLPNAALRRLAETKGSSKIKRFGPVKSRLRRTVFVGLVIAQAKLPLFLVMRSSDV